MKRKALIVSIKGTSLSRMEKILLSKEKPCGAISFWVESMHPHDLATILDQDGIAIRAGHHCAKPLHQHLNVQASVRLSLHAYNDFDDIDDFIESLKGAFSFLL